MTFTLTPEAYFASLAKVEKINIRAQKRGFTGRFTLKAERVERTSTNQYNGLQTTVVEYKVEVDGEAPKYNGWTFLARVDALGDTFTLATAPGVEHVDRSLVKPGHCDHCTANRARRCTYLVRNEQGEVKNVGSTCIKDFLGWDGAISWGSTSDVEKEVENLGGSFPATYSVDTVLAFAYAATKVFGWVPASAYSGTPTRSVVAAALRPFSNADKEAAEALRPVAAEAFDKAAEIKAFILSEAFAGQSTYVENLKAAVEAGFITNAQMGLVVSAPNAYTRHLETEADRKAREARWAAEKDATAASEYLGQEGDKITVEGTISAIRYIEGYHSTTTLYTILTSDGNLVKWFASRSALGDDEGKAVKITGTVKKHDDYQGTKSTVLTRCKEVA